MARLLAVLPALLAATLSACGTASAAGESPRAGPAPLSNAEFEALYQARSDSALLRVSADDVRFMSAMIHHHAQALEMARMAPTHTTDRSIRTLAARIHNAQADEIALMQRWLRERGRPVPELHEMGGRLMVHGPGHDHGAMMPGMLTDEQLARLDGARGPAFDRLFLELMIEHHRGAVSMVRELFATDGAAQDEVVFRFASDAQVDQLTEVRRMESMLSALPAGGTTP
jgi:uncharacterized protein (DUF305 family)